MCRVKLNSRVRLSALGKNQRCLSLTRECLRSVERGRLLRKSNPIEAPGGLHVSVLIGCAPGDGETRGGLIL